MLKREFLCGLAAASLAGCASGGRARIGEDGLPVAQVYNIGPDDTDDIQFRTLDALNTLRQAAGVAPVQLDAQLTASAATHARDMAVQNRPWLFGSDGSSPLERAARAGFRGRLTGEAIAESYETELQTLAAWMNDPNTRFVLLNPEARRMGIAWFQEPAGKLWWTLSMGTDPIFSTTAIAGSLQG